MLRAMHLAPFCGPKNHSHVTLILTGKYLANCKALICTLQIKRIWCIIFKLTMAPSHQVKREIKGIRFALE